MAARTAQQQPDLTGLVAAIGLAAGVAAAVFGYGGAPLVLVGLVVAGFMATPPVFTGKKDRNGQPTPAHPGESRQMRVFRIWKDLRWRLFTPNADWLPGKDPAGSWFAGLLVGAAVAGLPVSALPDLGWAPLVNGLCAAVVVWQVTATLRRNAADYDPSPGLRVGALRRLPATNRWWWALLAGAAVATVVGATVAGAFVPESVRGAYGPNSRFVASWALGLVAGGAVLVPVWRDLALSTWRELVAAREQWEPRWANVGLKDDNPWLVEHTTLGPVTVDTFDAPASTGAAWFCNPGITGKVTVTLGANQRVWIISCPNEDGQGQPVPGSAHPTRFRVVHLPADQMPDLTDASLDAEMVKVLLEGAMAAACDVSGVSRYLMMSADLVTRHDAALEVAGPGPQGEGAVDVEDLDEFERPDDVTSSPWAVWATTWVNPDGLDGSYLRNRVRGALSGALGVPVLVDHRFGGGQGLVLVGPASHPDVVFDPGTGLTVAQAVDIEREDVWRSHWESVLKQDVNAPRPELSLYAEAKLPGRKYMGTTVYYLPFVTLKGEPPELYFGLETKLQAALNAAPFVATTGFPGPNANARAGDRHPQAVCVIWSDGPVPEGPQTLPPPTPGRGSNPDVAKWVLAGRFNQAFKAARLAQPEVAKVQCLTAERSAGHIWRVDVRLYGGVTLSDVRAAAARIRGALGCAWLRIADAEDGCIIFAGERPEKVRLANPDRHKNLLIALDWEQAWLDSKVSGVGGLLPKLTGSGTLPRNEQVQVLDFALPAGLSVSDVKSAVDKLKTATGNAFIDVRATDVPSSVRLLVCEVNPLPDRVAFDFDFVDTVQGIPFATGVEGEPVVFDPFESPHALLAGVTGAGKSVLAQAFIYGFLVRNADLYVVDPMKGGADFQFAKDHAKAFASTTFEAAAVMKHVYAEVVRRKNLNAKYGVGSYADLPDDVRPVPLVVMIDEFTSLMQHDPVPPATEDPDALAEREAVLASNHAKTIIGVTTGKLAREARSAGVTLLLGTQKLTAKLLDSIPGAGDLKTNLARTLLGKANHGERASALRAFDDAPKLEGFIPKGRGLWEPLTNSAVVVQVWYAPQDDLRRNLLERRAPLREDERADIATLAAELSGEKDASARRGRVSAEPEVVELGEVDIEWDEDAFALDAAPADEEAQQGTPVAVDIEVFPGEPADAVQVPELPDVFAEPHVAVAEVGAEAAAVPQAVRAAVDPSAVLFLDVDGTVCPVAGSGWADAVQVDGPHGHVWVSPSMMARLGATAVQVVWATDWHDEAAPVLDPLLGRASHGALGRASGEEYGWWKIDAIVTWLDEHPQVRTVVFADDRLDRADELDVEYRETLADVLEHRGVRHLLLVPSGPDLTEQDVEQIEAMFGRVPAHEPVAPVAVTEPKPESAAEPAAEPQRPARAERAKRDLPPREQWVRPGSAKPKEYIEEF